MFRHREWLEQSNTDDQQQHIIQGYAVDPELVGKAIAGEKEVRKFNTTEYPEVRDFLGFDLPQTIFISNWEPKHYSLYIQPTHIQVVVLYAQKDDQQVQMVLDLRLFTNIENAFVSYEQELNGTIETVENVSVYFSNNYDNNAALWTTDNGVYWLRSNIEKAGLKDIVQQIIGGKQHE